MNIPISTVIVAATEVERFARIDESASPTKIFVLIGVRYP
jgi:hypothetical protein